MMPFRWLSIPLATLLCVGCEPTRTTSVEARVTRSALTASNGRELNGRELNGRELNGRELNGRELNGRELNGRELNGVDLSVGILDGVTLSGTALVGSELVATTSAGVRRGADMTGVIFTDGDLQLRIDAVAVSAADPEIFEYLVSFQDSDIRGPGRNTWGPLCGTDATGALIPAIPISGYFDPRQGVPGGGAKIRDPSRVTFACEGYAIAKCVVWGYAPWRKAQQCSADGSCWPVDLDFVHEACTRLVRADYCGDGRSFTRNGTLIDLYDGLGIQLDTESWEFEAEWQSDGARCLDERRITGTTTVPHCDRNLSDPTCGDTTHFTTGTLLMTEFPD
jgi:hypothetical protein